MAAVPAVAARMPVDVVMAMPGLFFTNSRALGDNEGHAPGTGRSDHNGSREPMEVFYTFK